MADEGYSCTRSTLPRPTHDLPLPCLPYTQTCRVGTLPEQREGDAVDYRPLLHRDGSVLSVVYPQDLEQPECVARPREGSGLGTGLRIVVAPGVAQECI